MNPAPWIHTPGTARTKFTLDIGAMLLGSIDLPELLHAPMRVNPPGMEGPEHAHFVQPRRAMEIARFLLVELASPRPKRRERATLTRRLSEGSSAVSTYMKAWKSIEALAQRVGELGYIRPFHGIIRWGTVSSN